MDVREFEYLVMVAEQGSVTKAANQLFLTQSAMSKFVQKLELEMGVPLFTRVGKDFVPTYAGEMCIDAARQILTIHDELNKNIDKIAAQDKGRIRIGFHKCWSTFFFEEILPSFRQKYPGLEIQIMELNSTDTLKKMDSGELDIAVITVVWSANYRYVSETLRKQNMVLAVRNNDPLLQIAAAHPDHPYPLISLKEIKDRALIMRHVYQKSYSHVMDILQAQFMHPNVVLSTGSRENLLKTVEEGVGIGFIVDEPLLLKMYPSVRFISFANTIPDNYLSIIYYKGVTLTQAQIELMDSIKEKYGSLISKTN